MLPGHPVHDNELKEILKPIRPTSIKSHQTIEKIAENTKECESNCSCKKKEEGDNNSDITDDDDDNNNEQLETDDSQEEEDEESDIETDDDCLQVDDVSEHLVPVHGFQGGVSDMNHMIRVNG